MERRISIAGMRAASKSGKKLYEEMLLKELPGVKSAHQPMHAVLESTLDYSEAQGGVIRESQMVRNHALIHYLASLANSNNNADKFDFDFVKSLIQNGADVNSSDKSGQSIFHEVARSWDLHVAAFLLKLGANIDKQDQFGRSPLHVASAVDHVDMVEFLVKSGADINIATYNEGQMPIHFAAKNDGCKSLKMLLGYGANIDSRDAKNRTPLQVAAEMSRVKAAKLLVQHGAPATVNDSVGNSALVVMIEKIPHVAVEALNQLYSVSTINSTEYFYLNYLEGNRLEDPESPSYTALEIAVQNQEFDVILHPVMKRLISIKWQRFGRYGALTDLAFNLIFVVLWSILAVTTPHHDYWDWYVPWSENLWRLIIAILLCLMTANEIRKQVTGILRIRQRQKKWLSWQVAELQEDLAYCHPRWPQEAMHLNSEIEAIRNTPLISTVDSWIYFDWLSLALILATITSHLTSLFITTKLVHIIYQRIITVLLFVLWIRMLKFIRPFEGAGPFVVIFLRVFQDIVIWLILVGTFGVPYLLAFYITFGKTSAHPVPSYSSFPPLAYNMFSMVVVSDHDFDSLEEANPTMARILCSTYITVMAIINLNLLIALLSDTFSRVHTHSVANAFMQRAKTILLVEEFLSSKKRNAYDEFIKNNCSPEAVDIRHAKSMGDCQEDHKESVELSDRVEEMHTLLTDRLGKQYGEDCMSEFDVLVKDISEMRRSREQSERDMKALGEQLHKAQYILLKLCSMKGISVRDIDITETKTLSLDDSRFGGRRNSVSQGRRFSSEINENMSPQQPEGRYAFGAVSESTELPAARGVDGKESRSHSQSERMSGRRTHITSDNPKHRTPKKSGSSHSSYTADENLQLGPGNIDQRHPNGLRDLSETQGLGLSSHDVSRSRHPSSDELSEEVASQKESSEDFSDEFETRSGRIGSVTSSRSRRLDGRQGFSY